MWQDRHIGHGTLVKRLRRVSASPPPAQVPPSVISALECDLTVRDSETDVSSEEAHHNALRDLEGVSSESDTELCQGGTTATSTEIDMEPNRRPAGSIHREVWTVQDSHDQRLARIRRTIQAENRSSIQTSSGRCSRVDQILCSTHWLCGEGW